MTYIENTEGDKDTEITPMVLVEDIEVSFEELITGVKAAELAER